LRYIVDIFITKASDMLSVKPKRRGTIVDMEGKRKNIAQLQPWWLIESCRLHQRFNCYKQPCCLREISYFLGECCRWIQYVVKWKRRHFYN